MGILPIRNVMPLLATLCNFTQKTNYFKYKLNFSSKYAYFNIKNLLYIPSQKNNALKISQFNNSNKLAFYEIFVYRISVW